MSQSNYLAFARKAIQQIETPIFLRIPRQRNTGCFPHITHKHGGLLWILRFESYISALSMVSARKSDQRLIVVPERSRRDNKAAQLSSTATPIIWDRSLFQGGLKTLCVRTITLRTQHDL